MSHIFLPYKYRENGFHCSISNYTLKGESLKHDSNRTSEAFHLQHTYRVWLMYWQLSTQRHFAVSVLSSVRGRAHFSESRRLLENVSFLPPFSFHPSLSLLFLQLSRRTRPQMLRRLISNYWMKLSRIWLEEFCRSRLKAAISISRLQ